MNCLYLEDRLAALLAAALPAGEEKLCAQHLETCEVCQELVEMAHLGEAAPGLGAEAVPDLAPAVLARTSGGACGRARDLLSESLDGLPERIDQELLLEHLAACTACRDLNRVLLELAHDLPRLAVMQPDRGFVDDVLKRTLPVEVQLRRWWARLWPRLVRRPRFALESAYLCVVVLVVVFATPGSPLGAVPSRSLAIAQGQPLKQIELPAADLRSRLGATAQAIRESKGGRLVADWRATGEAAADRAAVLVGRVQNRLGTIWDDAASLLERTDEESATEPETIEETS
jgi:hypothetical protein